MFSAQFLTLVSNIECKLILYKKQEITGADHSWIKVGKKMAHGRWKYERDGYIINTKKMSALKDHTKINIVWCFLTIMDKLHLWISFRNKLLRKYDYHYNIAPED